LCTINIVQEPYNQSEQLYVVHPTESNGQWVGEALADGVSERRQGACMQQAKQGKGSVSNHQLMEIVCAWIHGVTILLHLSWRQDMYTC
jgi:hypothetical protein